MKHYFQKIILLAATGVTLLASCKKDLNNKVTYNGGTAPVLTASVSDSIPLPLTDTTGNAVTFNWTNPSYLFTDGPNSLNVTYYLQFDTMGANFHGPNMVSVAFSSNLTSTFTVSVFNNIMANQLKLDTFHLHHIQARVMSFIQPYSSASQPTEQLYSDTLNFTVYPYFPPPVVAPPATDTLYITGGATPDNWMVGGDPTTVAGQGLKRVSPTLYTITLPLIGGQQFLLVPVAGDWTNKYGTSSSSPAPTGGSFGYNSANNFNGPLTSGTYTVTVDFESGTYTITQ